MVSCDREDREMLQLMKSVFETDVCFPTNKQAYVSRRQTPEHKQRSLSAKEPLTHTLSALALTHLVMLSHAHNLCSQSSLKGSCFGLETIVGEVDSGTSE